VRQAFDLAVFGSGFAAWEVTRHAAAAGRRVLVVERGGRDFEAADPSVSRVPASRAPVRSGGFDFGVEVPPAFDGVPRYIGLGGTSELWSGKWRRLDAIDFAREHDGRRWLLGAEELTPWYARVAADYGWPDWSCDEPHAEHRDAAAAHGLRCIDIYEERPPIRLRRRWLELERGGRVEVACDAALAGAEFDAGSARLQRVRLEVNGGTRVVEAAAFVVACGGIESIHVSHALRSARPGARPLQQRYRGFADHPKAFVGDIVPSGRVPLLEYLEHTHRARRRLIAFGLPEDEILRDDLGNHTVFVTQVAAGAPWQVMISLEQFPEPENYIAVSPPDVCWGVSERTRADGRAFLARMAPRLESLIGRARIDAGVAYRGASHHAAALPMGEAGVGHVDRDCRFHDVANLFCVSSAVFPIAGSANPTMTIVALARRLAAAL
jgi:choline dehydrogenase-like flavoprotein